MIVLAPLVAFILLITGVRSRRAAAVLTTLGALASLAAVVLASWGRWPLTGAYTASYEYLNLSVVFSGAFQFQSFVMNFNLGADHLALTAAGLLALITILAVSWNRTGGRYEPGPIRTQAGIAILLFGALGVVFSHDLAELLLFWGLAGAATYLLMANRWGDPQESASRVALWLPFATDLALLAGVALLYSRFGQVDLGQLPAALHTTSGAGLKSLTAACILIGIGAAGRAGLFPFQRWQTATAAGPPVAAGLAQAVWPLLSAVLVFRCLPLFHSAGPQALYVLALFGVAGAVAGGAAGLAFADLRTALTAVGSAVTGLLFVALAYGSAAAAVAAILALVPARAAAVLAAAGIATAVRSGDLALVAAAFRLMRLTAIGLGLALVSLAVAAAQAAAAGLRPSGWSAAYGAGLLLAGAAAGRVYASAAFGTLLRRRAFDPTRVREAPPGMVRPVFVGGLLAFGLAVMTFSPGWLHYLDGSVHAAPSAASTVTWLALAAVGPAVGLALFGIRRTEAASVSARARELGGPFEDGWTAAGTAALSPAFSAADDLDGPGLARAEESFGRALATSGAVTGIRITALPALLAIAVLAALGAALLSAGVLR